LLEKCALLSIRHSFACMNEAEWARQQNE